MPSLSEARQPGGGETAARPMLLAEKIWNAHVVDRQLGEPDLLYVDLHLVHEASSPQAFDGLRLAGRSVRRPDLTLAVEDHNVPTDALVLSDPLARTQVEALRRNCAEHGLTLFQLGEREQGIVHVIGPEAGIVLPGMTVVCGDSHTSTHGALGALGFGLGTSEVEHVLATQMVALRPWRYLQVDFAGTLPDGVTAKDLALAMIGQLGPNGGQGYIVEYTGDVVRALSVEARMTLCNMTIEAGARAGLVAPDETTMAYLSGRRYAPAGARWEQACQYWASLASDPGAAYDRVLRVDCSGLSPYVTWGTSPAQAMPLHNLVPDPGSIADPAAREAAERALEYMAIEPGTSLGKVPVDAVFVGSCTNARIEDLRSVASVLRHRHVAPGVRMLIVPGSMQVRREAEQEGLAEIFTAAGAEWRNSGCSMCLGMNPDRLPVGARCASTSNRNFQGRQGPGVRTHLVSPAVAAATAVTGRFASPADL